MVASYSCRKKCPQRHSIGVMLKGSPLQTCKTEGLKADVYVELKVESPTLESCLNVADCSMLMKALMAARVTKSWTPSIMDKAECGC